MVQRRAPVLSSIVLVVATLAWGSDLLAQAPAQKDGPVFVYGGVLVTSIYHDTQDTAPGYLHYTFIGELDWPATGLLAGAGVSISRRWSAACELAYRQEMSTEMAVESQTGHFSSAALSGLYTSRETLVSFLARYDAFPVAPITLQPLGGLTLSSATRTLTDQRGFSQYGNYPPFPVTRPDASVSATDIGFVGGVDLAVRLGRGVAVIAAPRLHWIHRDVIDEYDRVVPNAGRWITSVAFGVQWRPVAKGSGAAAGTR